MERLASLIRYAGGGVMLLGVLDYCIYDGNETFLTLKTNFKLIFCYS